MQRLINDIRKDCPELEVNSEQLQHHIDEMQTENISWMIRTFASIGAWFGMITFMGFLGAVGFFDDDNILIVTGILFIIGSLTLPNFKIKNLFLEPISLGLGLAGQGMCLIAIDGFFSYKNELLAICFVGLIVETIFIVFTKSQTQRFLATIAFGYCVLGVLFELDLFAGVHFFIGLLIVATTLLLLFEDKIMNEYPKLLITYNTFTFALSISVSCLVAIHAFLITSSYKVRHSEKYPFIEYDWIVSVMAIGCAIYTVYHLLKEHNMRKYFEVFMIGTSVLLISTFFMSAGISWAFLLIILGVLRSQKIILTIGVVCFLYFLNLFYYSLEISLLNKSIILMISGALFAAIGLFIRLKLSQHDEK